MKIITGSRDLLGTFALTVATGAIGLASFPKRAVAGAVAHSRPGD